MHLELEVRARHWYSEDNFPRHRDVYLHRRDEKEPACVMPFLMHVSCPVASVSEIVEWAEALGVLVVYDPPGNMVPDWKWPVEAKPPAPVDAPKPIPSF